MPRWIGIDWGFAHSAVVEWACQDGKVTKQYREYKVAGLGPRALAQEIVDRSHGEKIDAVYLSPDAFAHRTSESSIAEQIGQVLTANKLPHPIEADNDRVGGWMKMYEMLKAGEWQIGDSCQALIEQLPILTRDEKKPEDAIKFEGDDAADATRYLIYSRHRGRQAPVIDRIEQRIAEAPVAFISAPASDRRSARRMGARPGRSAKPRRSCRRCRRSVIRRAAGPCRRMGAERDQLSDRERR